MAWLKFLHEKCCKFSLIKDMFFEKKTYSLYLDQSLASGQKTENDSIIIRIIYSNNEMSEQVLVTIFEKPSLLFYKKQNIN